VEDWGKVLGDARPPSLPCSTASSTGCVLECGPRSWRTKIGETLPADEAVR
jgi:hypothetical protein